MKVTYILTLACIITFVITFFSNPEEIFDNYGFSGQNLLVKPYVLITSIFLHANLEHLLSNILVLLIFGLAVENELGWAKMLYIFFLGAVAGDMLSLLIYSFDTIAVGASAGIFALVGTGMLVRPFDLSMYPYLLPIPLGLLGVLYAVYNTIGFIEGEGNISYIAHSGGLLVGFLFGMERVGVKKSLKIIILMTILMLALPYILRMIFSVLFQ